MCCLEEVKCDIIQGREGDMMRKSCVLFKRDGVYREGEGKEHSDCSICRLGVRGMQNYF